jgi:prepilin-type N-terminal cleavage/methylation domain-containing protein
MMSHNKPFILVLARRAGFSLVELMVSIGIIVILMGLLLPSLSKARQSANSVMCQNNLRQCGLAMLSYADEHDGWLFPGKMGYNAQHVIPYPDNGSATTIHNVWPALVFGVWNPPVMICPVDAPLDPVEQHSYVVNSHMQYWNVKYSSRLPDARSPSDVVLMGEKFLAPGGDYYMEYGDFVRLIDTKKHGLHVGANYLMLDMHVEPKLITTAASAEFALDPWDFAAGAAPPATTGSN